jgi:hypothetical protein
VLSANVFVGVLDELASGFERISEHKVAIIYETAGTIENRIHTSEFADETAEALIRFLSKGRRQRPYSRRKAWHWRC